MYFLVSLFSDPVRKQPAISASAATGGFFVEFTALECCMPSCVSGLSLLI